MCVYSCSFEIVSEYTLAVNVLAYGRKRWTLYAPQTLIAGGWNPLASLLEWLEAPGQSRAGALECEQGPGDVRTMLFEH